MTAPDNDVGTIIMRMPNGKKSAIVVSLASNNTIDVTFQRSSEGKLLVSLPVEIAKKLSQHLATAAALACPSKEAK